METRPIPLELPLSPNLWLYYPRLKVPQGQGPEWDIALVQVPGLGFEMEQVLKVKVRLGLVPEWMLELVKGLELQG